MSSSTRVVTHAELAKHKSYHDCWVAILGRVYDISEYLSVHPGGESILRLHGGTDVTEAFLDLHNEDYLLSFLPDTACIGALENGNPSPLRRSTPFPTQVTPHSILALERRIYTPAHEAYRAAFVEFLKREVMPNMSKWERRGYCDPKMFAKAAEEGFYLSIDIPRKFGGRELGDWRYNAIISEEMEHVGAGNTFFNLGTDMALSYVLRAGEAQKQRWLPRFAKGEMLAIAMSEPHAGSDLMGMKTIATRHESGDWILNGRKMWISHGKVAQCVVVAAITDPQKGSKGISMLMLEKGMPGFKVAKRFSKMGKHGQDTCLLTFKDVRVPHQNLLGEEGKGFIYLMQGLPKERLSIAVGSIAAARRCLALTVNYVNGRKAFGGTLGGLQSMQHQLATMLSEVQSCTTFVDSCVELAARGKLSTNGASMAKLMATELVCKVADNCMQFYGGYGYVKNNPVAKIWADQRVTRIYGGASEVMREIVGKNTFGFKPQRFGTKKKKTTSKL